MSWKCLFLGCKWSKFLEHYTEGRLYKTDICKRCGAHRTTTVDS